MEKKLSFTLDIHEQKCHAPSLKTSSNFLLKFEIQIKRNRVLTCGAWNLFLPHTTNQSPNESSNTHNQISFGQPQWSEIHQLSFSCVCRNKKRSGYEVSELTGLAFDTKILSSDLHHRMLRFRVHCCRCSIFGSLRGGWWNPDYRCRRVETKLKTRQSTIDDEALALKNPEVVSWWNVADERQRIEPSQLLLFDSRLKGERLPISISVIFFYFCFWSSVEIYSSSSWLSSSSVPNFLLGSWRFEKGGLG